MIQASYAVLKQLLFIFFLSKNKTHHLMLITYLVSNSHEMASLSGSVGCASDWRTGGHGLKPRRGRQHSFVEIDHEIFSTVILSLPLIQEGQLSVSGKRMCTILVYSLED